MSTNAICLFVNIVVGAVALRRAIQFCWYFYLVCGLNSKRTHLSKFEQYSKIYYEGCFQDLLVIAWYVTYFTMIRRVA